MLRVNMPSAPEMESTRILPRIKPKALVGELMAGGYALGWPFVKARYGVSTRAVDAMDRRLFDVP